IRYVKCTSGCADRARPDAREAGMQLRASQSPERLEVLAMGKAAGVAAVLVLVCAGTIAAARVSAGQAEDEQRVMVAAEPTRSIAVLGGRGVQIGVRVRDLEPEQQKTGSGAVVERVEDGSPAEKAGLKAGDVITEFDGERVRSARHLARLVGETPEGREVSVTVRRDSGTVTLSVSPEVSDM